MQLFGLQDLIKFAIVSVPCLRFGFKKKSRKMTETLDKIDVLSGKYYTIMGRKDYCVEGIGKFKLFCKNRSDHADN